MSIAKKTKSYVIARPAIHECLRRGIINFSALAREIQSFYQIESTPPIVVAATRYAERLKRLGSIDKKITQAIQNSQVHLLGDIIHFSVSCPLTDLMSRELLQRQHSGTCRLFEGNRRGIVTCQSQYAAEIRGILGRRILREYSELIEISISQSLDVVRTPGVAARLFGLLGESGINIYDTLMLAGEHILYCHMKDLPQVHRLIHEGYLGRKNAKQFQSG